ncbi:molybdopterin-dependent oxidoreductase [Belliella sp. DSM 111904]|uniref:Molybdopterin-dependent oxidoreductase n=1 Tax=Belliella filtrata TaxID=2923435 RepID=A0ABS9UXU5_9BACT|nr:molybdopterin cofactor-binding domain-containing protein [Belliella filtrata]MCH7409001.1 molybdopterin-dependent oxidoreductase [Belliella filtrata]
MKDTTTNNQNRRSFLKASGQLIIGFNLFPFLQFCANPENQTTLSAYPGIEERPHTEKAIIDSWIRLDAEGFVTVLTGKQELGQGIRTALMQIAAEELEVPFDICHIINGDTAQTANEGYTAGSNSVEGSGSAIRQAAAEAKYFLIQEAAKLWQVNIDQVEVNNGEIHGPENKKISYWKLLDGKFLEGKITGEAPIKNPSNHVIVGKSIPRADISKMIKGEPHFIHDLRLEGMLHARVVHPPSYNAKLEALDESEISQLPGVVRIIVDGSFVAIVAKREYQAIKAREKIIEIAKWESTNIKPAMGDLFSDMKNKASKPKEIEASPTINQTIKQAKNQLKSTYRKPYTMHGSTGPGCAVAQWDNQKLTVWSPTQGVYPLQNTLADLFSIEKESIRCIGMPGSGCYGHNSADDVSAEAAMIAKHLPNQPVRLQWMRDNEHRWEPYGSAMQLTLEAGMDQNGKITSWKTEIWSDTHSTRPNGNAGHYVSARHLAEPFEFKKGGFSGGSYRNASPLYDIADKALLLNDYEGPLRTSALRGLGAYGNIFALESFIDELASSASMDPFEFRIRNLKNNRAVEVLNTLKSKTDWDNLSDETKSKCGIAFAQYKNSAAYFAVMVTLENEGEKLKIKKMIGVIEAGQCINPDGLINQTEGGMIQSASWTILESVQYNEKEIISTDWNSYPIFRANDIPEIEVHIINRPEEKPLGAGEAAQGPVAAAIVNAVSNHLGKRIYELPLREYFS